MALIFCFFLYKYTSLLDFRQCRWCVHTWWHGPPTFSSGERPAWLSQGCRRSPHSHYSAWTSSVWPTPPSGPVNNTTTVNNCRSTMQATTSHKMCVWKQEIYLNFTLHFFKANGLHIPIHYWCIFDILCLKYTKLRKKYIYKEQCFYLIAVIWK